MPHIRLQNVTNRSLIQTLFQFSICAVVCICGCSDASHETTEQRTAHVQKPNTASPESIDSQEYPSPTMKRYRSLLLAYYNRMQRLNTLYSLSDFDPFAQIVVCEEKDTLWWCDKIGTYTVTKITHCRITNALARVYAQATTSAERLYVRRQLAEVALEAHEVDRALELLLNMPEGMDLSDESAHATHGMNMHRAAFIYTYLLKDHAQTRDVYQKMTTIDSALARALGYSGLAYHYAKTDVEEARETLRRAREHTDSDAPLYVMLYEIEDALHAIYSYYKSRSDMPSVNDREWIKLRRDVFWDVPNVQDRIQEFRVP